MAYLSFMRSLQRLIVWAACLCAVSEGQGCYNGDNCRNSLNKDGTYTCIYGPCEYTQAVNATCPAPATSTCYVDAPGARATCIATTTCKAGVLGAVAQCTSGATCSADSTGALAWCSDAGSQCTATKQGSAAMCKNESKCMVEPQDLATATVVCGPTSTCHAGASNVFYCPTDDAVNPTGAGCSTTPIVPTTTGASTTTGALRTSTAARTSSAAPGPTPAPSHGLPTISIIIVGGLALIIIFAGCVYRKLRHCNIEPWSRNSAGAGLLLPPLLPSPTPDFSDELGAVKDQVKKQEERQDKTDAWQKETDARIDQLDNITTDLTLQHGVQKAESAQLQARVDAQEQLTAGPAILFFVPSKPAKGLCSLPYTTKEVVNAARANRNTAVLAEWDKDVLHEELDKGVEVMVFCCHRDADRLFVGGTTEVVNADLRGFFEDRFALAQQAQSSAQNPACVIFSTCGGGNGAKLPWSLLHGKTGIEAVIYWEGEALELPSSLYTEHFVQSLTKGSGPDRFRVAHEHAEQQLRAEPELNTMQLQSIDRLKFLPPASGAKNKSNASSSSKA